MFNCNGIIDSVSLSETQMKAQSSLTQQFIIFQASVSPNHDIFKGASDIWFEEEEEEVEEDLY